MYWNKLKFLTINCLSHFSFSCTLAQKYFALNWSQPSCILFFYRGTATLAWGGLLCPVVTGLDLAGISVLPFQSPQPLLGMDTQHDMRTPRREKAAPAWLVARQWFLQSWEQLTCEHWALPHKQGWISEQAGPTADTCNETRAHGYYSLSMKAQSSILHFIFG